MKPTNPQQHILSYSPIYAAVKRFVMVGRVGQQRWRCKDLWSIWPLSPVIDEIHDGDIVAA
ncbi:hypothetical protein [Arcanobacterium pinnipediorum]|uniref:Uncharacterized protein n=1 Tax=Arcanobacterium pinnipediorum TaxID=1503041 RepID=A0ABY5AHX9_9ACTO|nr:hypothetical protein [Arcanobacterium pinnipediorum]USR79804.1 hypothetical protein NG665_02120 [Arcanobacterium pinnipediorum]